MNVHQSFVEIREIYEKCKGDMEETKRTYKSTYRKHITNRYIMKALSGKMSDTAVKEAYVEDIDGIQVKEEEINCEDDIIHYFEDPLSENQNLTSTGLDEKLQYNPIVYTTRLEDMHIFKKNLENINFSSIAKQVEAESKPRLISNTVVQQDTIVNNSTSVDELVNTILEQFNPSACTGIIQKYKEVYNELKTDMKSEPEAAANDSRLKDKIHKLCKPLTVTLVDCKYLLKVSKLCKAHENYPLCDSVRSCPKCIKTFKVGADVNASKNKTLKIDDDVDVSKNKPSKKVDNVDISKNKMKVPINDNFGRIIKIGEKVVNFWVVMKNIYLNQTDIYNVRYDQGISTIYCRINHVIIKDRELALYITNTNQILEYINCCWLKRYVNIQKTFYGQKAPYIWVETHPCPYDKCICCCSNLISIALNDKSLESCIVTKFVSEGRLTRPQQLPSADVNNAINWLNKAWNYQRLSKVYQKPMLIKAPDQGYRSNACFSIRVRIGKHIHQYIARLDGQVQSYIVFKRHCSKMIKSYVEIASSYEILKYFSTSSCCWITYNELLTNIMSTMPVYLHFLAMPHNCSPGRCSCCCRATKLVRDLKFKPFEQPMKLSHTKRNTSKYENNFKIYDNKLKICTNKQCLAQSDANAHLKPQTNEPTIKIGRASIAAVPVALLQTVESKLNQPKLPVPEAEDPAVSSLIVTILDRFKNIRLTLNPEGKVMAELDTPATDLSNDELKILSNILAHAQNQVNTMGITYDGNTSISYPIVSGGYPGMPIPEQANVNVANASTSTSQVPSGSYDCNAPDAFSKTPILTVDDSDQNNSNEFQNTVPVLNELEEAKEQLQETVNLSTDLYDAYTKLTYFKNEQYKRSLKACTKQDEKSFSLPQIQSTFSLKEVVKPINVQPDSISIDTNKSIKRKLKSYMNPKKKMCKPDTDIKIVNVHSQSTSQNLVNMQPAQPPPLMAVQPRPLLPVQQRPLVAVQPQTLPSLVPRNYPHMQPMLVLQNPTNMQYMPTMPHQMLPNLPINTAIMQPVVVPNNFVNSPVRIAPPVPVVNNQTHLVDLLGKPESGPTFLDTDNDETDDCILGV